MTTESVGIARLEKDTLGESRDERQEKYACEMGYTLPAGLTGGLHLNLDFSIIRGPFLATVIRCHGELVEALSAILQFLSIFNVPWQNNGEETKLEEQDNQSKPP